MAPTLFFLLIVALLIFAAARLYRSSSAPSHDTFMEDRLSRLLPSDLIDAVTNYANRTEQSVEEVMEEAVREFLQRRKDGLGDGPDPP